LRNALKQTNSTALKEITENRFNNEAGKWNFNSLDNAYQSKDAMLAVLSFNKWNLAAIENKEGGTCAVRMSNALNRAGYTATMDHAHLNTKISTMSGKNSVSGEENRYIMSAHKLATHLGVVENGKKISDISEIKDSKGIIYFENAHIDLWNKDRMVGNGQLEASSELNKKTIYFLELK
jgi:hypothetical protein